MCGASNETMFRLLIVDNDAAFAKSQLSFLAAYNYEVKVANNRDDALSLVAEFNPQLVLIDTQLDGSNSIDLLDQFIKRDSEVCCLVCTSSIDVDSAMTFMRHGAVDYLVKPLSQTELVVALESAVEGIKRRTSKEVSNIQNDSFF